MFVKVHQTSSDAATVSVFIVSPDELCYVRVVAAGTWMPGQRMSGTGRCSG